MVWRGEGGQGVLTGGDGGGVVRRVSFETLSGIPGTALMLPGRLQEIVDRTKQGGAEIVKLLEKGSAYYAPSAATVSMVESILLDKKRVIHFVPHCQGAYGETRCNIWETTNRCADYTAHLLQIEYPSQRRK